jgi:hypothetical protein
MVRVDLAEEDLAPAPREATEGLLLQCSTQDLVDPVAFSDTEIELRSHVAPL